LSDAATGSASFSGDQAFPELKCRRSDSVDTNKRVSVFASAPRFVPGRQPGLGERPPRQRKGVQHPKGANAPPQETCHKTGKYIDRSTRSTSMVAISSACVRLSDLMSPDEVRHNVN